MVLVKLPAREKADKLLDDVLAATVYEPALPSGTPLDDTGMAGDDEEDAG